MTAVVRNLFSETEDKLLSLAFLMGLEKQYSCKPNSIESVHAKEMRTDTKALTLFFVFICGMPLNWFESFDSNPLNHTDCSQ